MLLRLTLRGLVQDLHVATLKTTNHTDTDDEMLALSSELLSGR